MSQCGQARNPSLSKTRVVPQEHSIVIPPDRFSALAARAIQTGQLTILLAATDVIGTFVRLHSVRLFVHGFARTWIRSVAEGITMFFPLSV